MRHRARVNHFHRGTGPRKALIRNLVYSLVEHGRIKTTLAKAKELRRHVEKAITTGKDADLHSRRLLLSRFPHEPTVRKIMDDLSPRFKSREGGYTKILKIGARAGDAAEMAFIQFVDYKPSAVTVDEKKQAAVKKAAQREYQRRKKNVRKLQGAARRELRAHLG